MNDTGTDRYHPNNEKVTKCHFFYQNNNMLLQKKKLNKSKNKKHKACI